jgi:hypothetical protein
MQKKNHSYVDYYSNDKFVWKVVDLWKEAEKYVPIRISIDEIINVNEFLNSHCWSDDKLSINEIMENADRVKNANLNYPVILTPDGCIADGCHRIVKALRQNKKTILAIKLAKMPQPFRSRGTSRRSDL